MKELNKSCNMESVTQDIVKGFNTKCMYPMNNCISERTVGVVIPLLEKTTLLIKQKINVRARINDSLENFYEKN